MELTDGITEIIDTGGVVAVALLLVWRIDKRLEVLTKKLGELVQEIREARRSS